MAVEAPVEALVGELGEEADERVRVGLLGRAQPQSAAFPQDDVDRSVLPDDGSGDSSVQWDIVPFGLPTLSKPTWPRSTCANACDDERVQALLVELYVEDAAPTGGTTTVWTSFWGGFVMSPLTQARSSSPPTTWKFVSSVGPAATT